jgi:valyl-tRNA synthetase
VRGAQTPLRPTSRQRGRVAGQNGPIELYTDVSRFIDVVAERKRLGRERDNTTKQIASIDGKLANKSFVDKAPVELVQQQREKLMELRTQLESIESALAKLPQ